MLAVGSRALLYHYPHCGATPADVDYIATYDELTAYLHANRSLITGFYPLDQNHYFIKTKDKSIVEVEIAWADSTAEEILALQKHSSWADPAMLLLLKESHKYLRNSPHFEKTRRDILFLRKFTSIPDEWQDLLRRREKETYNYEHPKLNVTKQEFFTSNVKYVYDHDSIHEAVARYSMPAYRYYMKPGEQVLCSKEAFERCIIEIKLAGVLEEAYVLALERSQIPFEFKPDREWSFRTALQKVCTSITSGWFREFAWINYDRVYAIAAQDDFSYVDRFQVALAERRVALYV